MTVIAKHAQGTHLARRNMRGQPIIFLGIVASVWIAARVIAYLPDAALPVQSPYGDEDIFTSREPSVETIVPNAAEIEKEGNAGQYHRPRAFGYTTHNAHYSVITAIPDSGPPQRTGAAIMAQHNMLDMHGHVEGTDSRNLSANGSKTKKARQLESEFLKLPLDSTPVMPGERLDKWSLHAWAFVRPGGSTLSVGQGQYGGSQVGVIGRYTLNPKSARNSKGIGPVHLYARFASALPQNSRSNFEGAELALGAITRPLRSVPVAVALEHRIGLGTNAQTRAAAYAVTQIPPIKLPGRFSADIYAQAGAAGIKNTQSFFDLQMVVERKAVRHGKTDISVGAGLWSGGQTGEADADGQRDSIARLDIGPRASIRFPIAGGHAKLTLDWRQRVAGNAEPGSGAALTLGADF